MALRIRKTDQIVCAAMRPMEEGDTYIDDDNIHYILSQITSAIVPSENHDFDALWFWNVKPEMEEHWREINR
jgi:hypothetical protein